MIFFWVILIGGIISMGGCSAILAEFDFNEGKKDSGDITKKPGSSCANGVCTIY